MGKKKGKRRPASYFIDFENVRGAGLDGVEGLHEGDRVTVLYGSKDSALKIEQVQHVQASPAKVEFVKVATGKHDALDFQLVALLFMKMKKSRDYFIISKDTGFDFAIRMAKTRGIQSVYRRESISGATLELKQLPKPRRSRQKRLPQPKAQEAQGTEASKPDAAPQNGKQPAEAQPSARDGGRQAAPEAPGAPQNGEASQPQQASASSTSSSKRRRRRSGGRGQQHKDPYRTAVEKVLVKHLGGGLPPAKRVDVVVEALQSCDTRSLFYNYLRKSLGREQGVAFYRDVKDAFDELAAIERPAAQAAPAEPAAAVGQADAAAQTEPETAAQPGVSPDEPNNADNA